MAAARYDLILVENTASSGVDFEEKNVTITRGGLLTATADANRTPRWLAAGSEGQRLTVDASGDLVWSAATSSHTQNTDTGTTGNTFTIDSDSSIGKMILDVATGAADKSITITNQALTDDIVITLPNVTGTLATEAFATGVLAANDAMIFKGVANIATIGALTTYNAGWTYRASDAGTV